MENTHHTPHTIRSWRKASRSWGGDSNCVEVGIAQATVGIRDSKLTDHDDYPVLSVTANDWNGLVGLVQTALPSRP
ncbi:DUF397 domain-containing protein [Stackebrandtia soli]|uniref:DUF397 domain-containing protein n=1 Tax=Stackebrandtia soli TaxID=1892856 RepID=UPI0039E75EAB